MEEGRGAPPGKPAVPRTAGEMVALARAFLERRGVEEARLEADLLVAHALDLDRLGLLMRLDRPVDDAEVDRARGLLVRRGRNEPVAYITGRREFYSRPFEVGPGVLVPRPESELLVDLARDHLRGRGGAATRVLDVGTGSGCLAVTLALEMEGATVVAVDSSAAAVAAAGRNAERLGAAVELHCADALAVGDAGAPWDVVVANPPYVDPADAALLPPDVRDHEPAEALFAPAGDRDHWVRELLARAAAWLAPGGVLLVELGHDQAPRALALAREREIEASVHADLAGVERVLRAAARRDR